MNSSTPSPAAAERSRGRPLDTRQQDLKAQLLNTAEQLFADQGYAATSIRQLADTVGVNPALVHYYFGNKHALLQAVLENSLTPLVQALAALRDDPEAPADGIARLILSMAAQHPNIPRLMTREVLLPGGEMQDFFIKNMAPHVGGALPALLAREKSAGRLREDFDPGVAALLVLAVSVFPFIARALAEPVLGIGFDTDGMETLTQHVSKLLERGMTA